MNLPACWSRKRSIWLVPLLLALFVVQATGSIVQKSVTVDEITYIAAGYYHLRTGDFSYNRTNPVLMKLVVALPLLAYDLELPNVADSPESRSQASDWQIARRFMYENRMDADTMLIHSRLTIVCLGALLGLLVWRWTVQLYGDVAGLLALTLFSFSPNVLAHARLATQDVGLTCFTFVATFLFWQYLRRPNSVYLILCGVSCGLAVAAKTPAVLMGPVFAVYAVICIARDNGLGIQKRLLGLRRIPAHRRRCRQTWSLLQAGCLMGGIALVTVNAVYAFQGTFGETIKGIPCPLPAAFVHGVRFQASLSDSVGGVYFAGQMYPEGLWYKLPLTLAMKTPIPLLLGVALSIGTTCLALRKGDVEWLFLALIACFMFVFSVSNVDGGLRYVLPIFPFLFVLAGRLARRPVHPRWVWGLTVGVVWYIASAVSIFPHYLAYCNEVVGPANGYKLFADSDIDWGQDLKGLKKYMERQGIEKIKLAYFGSADADHYGIEYEYLPSIGLKPKKPEQLWWYEIDKDKPRIPLQPQQGTIAISATLLAAPRWMRPFYEDYQWLREREPIDQIGYSILIYPVD